jgi:hypothetical protein
MNMAVSILRSAPRRTAPQFLTGIDGWTFISFTFVRNMKVRCRLSSRRMVRTRSMSAFRPPSASFRARTIKRRAVGRSAHIKAHLFQQGRQRRALRGLGTAATVFRRGSRGLAIAPQSGAGEHGAKEREHAKISDCYQKPALARVGTPERTCRLAIVQRSVSSRTQRLIASMRAIDGIRLSAGISAAAGDRRGGP